MSFKLVFLHAANTSCAILFCWYLFTNEYRIVLLSMLGMAASLIGMRELRKAWIAKNIYSDLVVQLYIARDSNPDITVYQFINQMEADLERYKVKLPSHRGS